VEEEVGRVEEGGKTAALPDVLREGIGPWVQ
jgi:hypothetical protein